MEKLARRISKVVLFCGLFFLAGRYVHTYPLPMTLQQQHYLILISDTFGVADYELFYIFAMVIIDIIVATIVYAALIKLCRYCWAKRVSTAAGRR
ncbi:hypothetical protein [Paraburkholderia tagetis]|uniref:Uncharacterized protein n=1 Tax=Paraburkholderia tagetis TaxID=2913261 RepID=A0A9X1RVP2_9BURK|nr:hypothetical protein [Paraburkholderia tagetis]MCG5075153.1 hypothetical protein [Paraburkholderia tagetis]